MLITFPVVRPVTVPTKFDKSPAGKFRGWHTTKAHEARHFDLVTFRKSDFQLRRHFLYASLARRSLSPNTLKAWKDFFWSLTSLLCEKKVIYCLFGHSKNFIYYWKFRVKISWSMKFGVRWISCSYYLLFVPYLIRARNSVPIFQCLTSLLSATEESNLLFVWIKICWSLKFQRFAYGVWWKKNLFVLLIFRSTSKRKVLFCFFIDSNIVWS